MSYSATSSRFGEPLLRRLDTPAIEEYAHSQQLLHDRELLQTDLSSVEPDAMLHTPIAALSFKNVGFSVKIRNSKLNKPMSKTILCPCSGHYDPGKLIAIMGPSGSGKTTLLDIIAGKKTSAHTGQVYLNGHQVLGAGVPRDSNFSRLTAYVPQHDVMPAHWCVEEAIMFNQSLRVQRPSKVKHELMLQRVRTFAADLGLDQVLRTPIGSERVRGISGGQRRRVTLARGLVTGANILFCDEPTSGLSSTDAEICIRLMRYSCLKRGISMFVVIHQPKPELALLFDELLLLTAEPGRVVYSGPMAAAQGHYERAGHPVPSSVNPLDYFLDLVTPSLPNQRSAELVDYFNAHCAEALERQVEAVLASPGMRSVEMLQHMRQKLLFLGDVSDRSAKSYNVAFSTQLAVVFRRGLTLMLRDRAVLFSTFAVEIVKSLVVGIAFFDIGSKQPLAQVSFVFMMLQMAALSAMQTMPRLIDERTVMKMETSDQLYSEWAYIVTSLVLTLTVSTCANLLFFLIAFALGGMPFGHFGQFYCWQFLSTQVLTSLFHAVAAVAKTGEQAQQLALPFLMLFILFNGFFVTLSSCQPWMKWAIYLSPMFYSIQQIAIALYQNPKGQNVIDHCTVAAPPQTHDSYEFQDDFTGIALVVLISEWATFRAFQAFALKTMNIVQR